MAANSAFQRESFLNHEGNGYFQRNQAALASTSDIRDLVVGKIAQHIPADASSKVLEIGCAAGANLAALASQRPVLGFGIDPSGEAIASGSAQHPEITLRAGTADTLPFDDGSLDVVWFGFCLYLVDRALLHKTVMEADRVLKDGGLLAVYDFDPSIPVVRPYRHVQGLMSYKMDYARLFLADPAYSLVEKVSLTHHGLNWSSDPQERVGLWLCRKDSTSAYHQLQT